MKDKKKQYWIGTDELNNVPEFIEEAKYEYHDEPLLNIADDEKTLNVKTNRRDFLKFLGFGLGAATVAAGCDIPVKKAIPYVVKPETIVPGIATYYASSFVHGGDYCPILVKTREGRPIKIEGNSLSPIIQGGTSARAQAYVLDLYDVNRLQNPGKVGADGIPVPGDWASVDSAAKAAFAKGNIRILTNTVMSPMTKAAIAEFIAKYPSTQVITIDPVSSSALLQANEATFGSRFVPGYRFDKADVIVSFGADFLGTWISPTEFAAQYVKNRKASAKNKHMSWHVQVESRMSLTGSNADNRIMVKPSEQGAAIATLYNLLAGKAGGAKISAPHPNEKAAGALAKVADKLWANRGKSLIVSGSNNKAEQILVNAMNNMLGNYGSTIDLTATSNQRQGNDTDFKKLVAEMNAGRVGSLIVMDANPAFTRPNSAKFLAGMKKVKFKVALGTHINETAAACDYLAPNHHGLESWGDVEAKRGKYSFIQPTIAPLFNTRQKEASLLIWADSPNYNASAEQPVLDYLQAQWRAKLNANGSFQTQWDKMLHDGVYTVIYETKENPGFNFDPAMVSGKLTKPGSGMEIAFFEDFRVGAGEYANNPWLIELPDAVSRTSWGNYLAIPIEWDGGNDFSAMHDLNPEEFKGWADKVKLTVGGSAKEVAVIRQFGQMRDTVSLSLGYGRTVVGDAGKDVGIDVNPWLSMDADGNVQYFAQAVEVSPKVGKDKHFSCVQYHHSLGVTGTDKSGKKINVDEKTLMTLGEGMQGGLVDRSVMYHTNVREMDEFLEHLKEKRAEAQELNSKTLYPVEKYQEERYGEGHHWGMHIDMNACIGCGACAVACMAENNVPVVGKKEVSRHHEMTWLRIDRYFYGDYENPNAVYQPMMCQHCDNAPCENVCPVNATNHSSEGLNQMAYNRCVGTRYCANNCPYKVRRFNWMDYSTADLFEGNQVLLNGEKLPYGSDNLTRMVLNPDVTVRVRGVIEKCSFCVQRLQEGKLVAKKEGRRLRDSDVKSACQTACPTEAIVMGDLNNKEGEMNKRRQNSLNFIALEEVNVASSVMYQTKVNNRDESLDA